MPDAIRRVTGATTSLPRIESSAAHRKESTGCAELCMVRDALSRIPARSNPFLWQATSAFVAEHVLPSPSCTAVQKRKGSSQACSFLYSHILKAYGSPERFFDKSPLVRRLRLGFLDLPPLCMVSGQKEHITNGDCQRTS
jgi:hypothetical protein